MEHEHKFVVAGRGGYYKKEKSGDCSSFYDQSIEYSMLHCEKCGETREIISADHRHRHRGTAAGEK